MEKSHEKPETETVENEGSSDSEIQEVALGEMKEINSDEAKKHMDDLFRSLILSKG